MRTPGGVRSRDDFGRIRLSSSFFLRDFLYSKIATLHHMVNLPDNPELAIAAGRALCENLLEPLQYPGVPVHCLNRSIEHATS
jgi:hypothetical protein